MIARSALQLKDTSLFYKNCKLLSFNCYRSGLIQEAIIFLKNSQELITEETSHGSFYNHLGNHYAALGYNIEALDAYFDCITWSRKYNELNLTTAIGNLSRIYFKNENYEKALDYMSQAHEWTLKMPDGDLRTYNLVHNYASFADLYRKIEEIDLAKEYMEKTLVAASEYGEDETQLEIMGLAISLYTDIGADVECEDIIKVGDRLLQDSLNRATIYGRLYMLERSRYYLENGQSGKAIVPDELQFEAQIHKIEGLSYASHHDVGRTVEQYEALLEENHESTVESSRRTFSNIEEKHLNSELTKENIKLTDTAE